MLEPVPDMTEISLTQINELPEESFVELFGGLFEHSPWVARATWPKRPFAGAQELHAAFCQSLKEAAPDQQMQLIRAHPDLVGRAARAGTLTTASTQEQAAAGLSRLSPEEISAFDDWNRRYQEKFGFPFIICARLNKKEAILKGFAERLGHSRTEEIAAALAEIEKIAWFRLSDKLGL